MQDDQHHTIPGAASDQPEDTLATRTSTGETSNTHDIKNGTGGGDDAVESEEPHTVI